MKLKEQLEDLIKQADAKLLAGDFTFLECGMHTAKVQIDGLQFEYWIANTPKDNFEMHAYGLNSILGNKPEGLFTTQQAKIKGYRMLKPHIDKFRKKTLLNEKLSKLEELKKEIEKLEN